MPSKVGIWQAQFDGTDWSPAQKVHFEEESVVWNPVVSKLPSGELLLFYRVGESPRSAVAFLRRSLDSGVNWSEPEMLPAGILGPVKNKPVVLEDGTLICPSSIQAGAPDATYRSTALWIDISSDGGKTWRKSGPLVAPAHPFGVIEPSLFFDKQGSLRLVCRDRALRDGKEGFIWTAVSHDRGLTWSELERTSLPNPDSAMDVVDLGEGRLVMFYNHSFTERFPLSVGTSIDGGKTWAKKCDLEMTTGEFPAAICTEDGLVHVTYAYEIESGQRRIKHVTLNPSELFEDTNL
jgi:predicted neuraminidase